MKKKFWVGLIAGMLFVGMSGTAQSLPIPPTLAEIGGLDTLIAWANLANSGDATETAWVNSVLGGGATLDIKYDVTAGEWFDVTSLDNFSALNGGTFAHTLDTAPAYFLIKTADPNGNIGNTYDHFLYANLVDVDWAVINLGALGFSSSNLWNIGAISHIGEYNGQPGQPVPEPAIMLLVGTGLAGLVARRWRKRG